MSRFALTILLLGCGSASAPVVPTPTAPTGGTARPTLEAGQLAPAFTLPPLDPKRAGSEMVRLRDHVGSRASDPPTWLVLSFGASYCKPCKSEIPELQALVAKRGAALRAWVVSIDKEQQGRDAMRQWAADAGITLPILADELAIVARRYGVSSVPFLVVLGADSRVRWTSAGAKEPIPALLAFLDRATN